MATKALRESGFKLGKVTGGTRWRARIINVGPGSSGFYTEEALKTSGAAAFPAGTKINADHQGFNALMENPSGSVTTLIGALVTDPVFAEATDSEPAGLDADVEFSQEWAPFVEQFAPILGLSIQGSGYGENMTETGLPIIEGFIPSPLNTVDLVTVPGAGGRLRELAESYTGPMPAFITENHARIGDAETNHGKDDGMTPEEITKLTEALVAAVAASVEKLKESLVPAPVADPVVTDAPEVSEVVEALVAAGLPKSARAKVLEQVKSGAKVDEAITAEKAYITELTEALGKADEAPTGTVRGTTKVTEDFTLGGWGN